MTFVESLQTLLVSVYFPCANKNTSLHIHIRVYSSLISASAHKSIISQPRMERKTGQLRSRRKKGKKSQSSNGLLGMKIQGDFVKAFSSSKFLREMTECNMNTHNKTNLSFENNLICRITCRDES